MRSNVQWFSFFIFFGIEYGKCILYEKKESMEEVIERMNDKHSKPTPMCKTRKCACAMRYINHIHNTIRTPFIYLGTVYSIFYTIFDRKKEEEILMKNLSFFVHCQCVAWIMTFLLFSPILDSIYCFVWPKEMQLSQMVAGKHILLLTKMIHIITKIQQNQTHTHTPNNAKQNK